MKHTTKAIYLIGILALAGPASAQIVNGVNGTNGTPEAPIGTKAGASGDAMAVPGEANAAAGAAQNTMDANNMQKSNAMTKTNRRSSTAASATNNMSESSKSGGDH